MPDFKLAVIELWLMWTGALRSPSLGWWLNHPYCDKCRCWRVLPTYDDVFILARDTRAVCLEGIPDE